MKDQRRLRRPFTSAGLAQTLKRTRAGIEQLGFGTYHQKDWLVHQDWRLALQCFPIIRILADMSIDTGERVLGHGDFKANNLLITPRIVVLDWLSMG